MSSSEPVDTAVAGTVVAAAAAPVAEKKEEEMKMDLGDKTGEEAPAATAAPSATKETVEVPAETPTPAVVETPAAVEVAAATAVDADVAPPSKKRVRVSEEDDGGVEDAHLDAIQTASVMMGKMTAAHMDKMAVMQQKLDEQAALRQQAEANLAALREKADRMPSITNVPVGPAATDDLASAELAKSLAELSSRCSGGQLTPEECDAMKFMPKVVAAACSRVVSACSAHIKAQEVAAAAAKAEAAASRPTKVMAEFAASMKMAQAHMDILNAATKGASTGKVVQAAAAKVAEPTVPAAAPAPAPIPAAAPATPAAPVYNPAAHFSFGNRVIEVAAAQGLDPRTQTVFHGVEMVDGMPVGSFAAPSANTLGYGFGGVDSQMFQDDAPLQFEDA